MVYPQDQFLKAGLLYQKKNVVLLDITNFPAIGIESICIPTSNIEEHLFPQSNKLYFGEPGQCAGSEAERHLSLYQEQYMVHFGLSHL